MFRPPTRSYRIRSAAPAAVALAGMLCLLPALLAGALQAAPEADPWPRWERHNDRNGLHIDHGAWREFLQRNLLVEHPSGIHRVDYAAVTRVDRLILDGYVKLLAGLPISTYSRVEQKAYWINLYNALTVQVVLDHYPVKSILDIDISPGVFSNGPWGAKLLRIEGEAVSLDDIEHRILRPLWRDPRVHYALNCASLGCPNLAREAYATFNIERLLEAGARAYVNHPRGVRFAGDTLVVSSLYVWFQADFGDSREGVLAHLRRYAAPALAERLAGWSGGYDHAYDWALNAP
jgi:hypothetical protein